MTNHVQRIVSSALFLALTTLSTMLIYIPLPGSGYANLGDCAVLLSGWILGPLYGGIAAGVGAAFADILSGYVLYAPATFLIKFLMAYCAAVLLRIFPRRFSSFCLIGIFCELIMIVGYYLYDAFLLHSFAAPLVNIYGNLLQGLIGLLLAAVIYHRIGSKLANHHDKE